MRHTGASGIWIIYPLYIVSLGGDKFWVGLIYSVNTLTQFFLMPYVERFKSKSLISVGLALSSTVFFAFTFAQDFYQLIPIQILLGGSWSCLYIGSLLYLMRYNVEKATCTGILSSLISLARVFGALLGGVVSELFGFKAAMYVAAALTAAGFVVFRISIKDKGV
jgi:predicted MFS family arabinose efflux permease